MKKNEILDVLFNAHTDGHQVELKFNFGINPLPGTMKGIPVIIHGGIFKINSIDEAGQEPVFIGTIHSEEYFHKEISISPTMIHTVARL